MKELFLRRGSSWKGRKCPGKLCTLGTQRGAGATRGREQPRVPGRRVAGPGLREGKRVRRRPRGRVVGLQWEGKKHPPLTVPAGHVVGEVIRRDLGGASGKGLPGILRKG